MKPTNQLLKSKVCSELWYTIRRYYVDRFFMENIGSIAPKSTILDMGGMKARKRGVFNIVDYDYTVKYANLDATTDPDYLGDITNIPLPDKHFDAIILSEVLEHVSNPVEILEEAFRLLKPEGIILICTPFQYHIHADPYDFARYTPNWYNKYLESIGFSQIEIEKQGGFFQVLANMIKLWVYAISIRSTKGKLHRYYTTFQLYFYKKLTFWLVSKSFQWDQESQYSNHKMFSNNTTGFGVIGKKIKIGKN